MLLQSSKHVVSNLLRSKKNPAGKYFFPFLYTPAVWRISTGQAYAAGQLVADSELGNRNVTTWRADSCIGREHIFSPHKACSVSQHGLTWSLQYLASKIPQILDYALSHPLCVHWIYMMLAGLKESFFDFPGDIHWRFDPAIRWIGWVFKETRGIWECKAICWLKTWRDMLHWLCCAQCHAKYFKARRNRSTSKNKQTKKSNKKNISWRPGGRRKLYQIHHIPESARRIWYNDKDKVRSEDLLCYHYLYH